MNSYDDYRRSPDVTDVDLDALRIVFTDVNQTWLESDGQHYQHTEPGTEAAFDAMADEFEARTKEHPAITDRFREATTTGTGTTVFARYFYAGILSGARSGLTLEQTSTAIHLPGTYRQLQLLTREKNAAAVDIEYRNGLRRLTYSSVDNDPDRYSLCPVSGLKMSHFALDRLGARLRLADEERMTYEEAYSPNADNDPIRCKINRRGAYAACYKAMLDISFKDPFLAESVFTRQSANTAHD